MLYLARRVKELYRESLVFEAVADYLRTDGNPLFDNLVAEARKSQSVEVAAILFESAIDAKIPPILDESEDQALAELIQSLGLDQGTIH